MLVGGENPRSVLDLLTVITGQVKRRLKPRLFFCKANMHESQTTHADSTRAKTELGFKARPGLENGVKDMLAEDNQIQILVVVATKNREQLLQSWALPSIQAQTLKPSKICVVIDEDPKVGETNITLLQEDFPEVSFIRNSQIEGASGAWKAAVPFSSSQQCMQSRMKSVLQSW
jgi:hypothetical protein